MMKFQPCSKLKAAADNNFIVAQMVQVFFIMLENIVGKGENAGYQHFTLFPPMFTKVFCSRGVKSQDCVN